MKNKLLTLFLIVTSLSFSQDDLKFVLKLDSTKNEFKMKTKRPFEVNKNKIFVGIFDGDKDGFYNSNKKDGIYIQDSISFKYRKINEVKYFNFYGAKYKINSIDSSGTSISISPTKNISEDSVMYFESKIRNFPFVNGTSTEHTYDYLIYNKLLLIVSWSEFCSPCIEEIEDLKKLQTQYKDKLTILALYSGNQEDLTRRVKTHKINYYVGLMNNNIKVDIQQNGFPYKILVSEDGTVLLKTGKLPNRKRLSDFVEVIEDF